MAVWLRLIDDVIYFIFYGFNSARKINLLDKAILFITNVKTLLSFDLEGGAFLWWFTNKLKGMKLFIEEIRRGYSCYEGWDISV